MSPDKRKGRVSVYQSDDQLMHLTWKDRGTGTLEDDLIIFPDDCEFLAVSACTTGRVFVLKFKTSNKRMFFWMQEPKSDKDEEICKKVNDSLNNPPAAGSSRYLISKVVPDIGPWISATGTHPAGYPGSGISLNIRNPAGYLVEFP